MSLRFYDPIVHYSDPAAMQNVGGFGINGTVSVPNSGGFQGGSHIQFNAGQAGSVEIDFSGPLAESSLGAIADTDTYLSFKVKVDGREAGWSLLQVLEGATFLGGLSLLANMGLRLSDKGGTVVDVPNVFRAGTWHHVMVRMNAIVGGVARVLVDGFQVINTTGDFSAAGVPDLIEFGDQGGASADDVHLDELLIWDAVVGAPSDGFSGVQSFHKMYAALPNSTSAAPTTVVGASTHEAQDDPLNANNDGDTTYVELADTDLMSVGFPALPSQTGFVRVFGMMAELDEGADLEPDSAVLRVDSNGNPGADFDLKPGLDSVSGYEMFRHAEPLDPDGGGFWTVGSAEAAELQIETVTAAPALGLPNTFGSARTAPGQPELQISLDGTNWTSTNLVPYPNQVPRNAARNPATGTIIYACDNGCVIRSTDEGLTWANINAGAALGIPLTFDGSAIWYGNGRWIMAGSTASGAHYYYSDDDGVSWTGPIDPDGGTGTGPTGSAPAGYSDLWYDGMWVPALGLHIGVGYRGNIWTSPDGLNWTERVADNNYIGSFYGFRGIDYSPSQGLLVAAGDPDEVQTSPDGITWTSGQVNATMTGMWGVVYSPTLDLWLVHGSGTSNLPIIQTSPDAVTWTDRSLPAPNNHSLYAGCWDINNGLFIVMGRFGRAHNSPDGINWTYTPPDNSAGSFVGHTSASCFAMVGGGNDK